MNTFKVFISDVVWDFVVIASCTYKLVAMRPYDVWDQGYIWKEEGKGEIWVWMIKQEKYPYFVSL